MSDVRHHYLQVDAQTDSVVPANPAILDGIDNLTGLSYLNEPSLLHNLRQRYATDAIYTLAGPVLVAINPFKQVLFTLVLSICP